MTPEERAAAAKAVGAAASRITDTTEEVSKVIRGRVRWGLSVLGPGATGAMDAVDGTHAGVYTAVRAGVKGASEAAAWSLQKFSDPEAPSLVEGEKTNPMLAAVGAAFGDALPEPLRPEMTWSVWDDASAQSAIVVFVHGLGGHHKQWGEDYRTVAMDAGFTPITVRYTTGHSIRYSAESFVLLMHDIVNSWSAAIEKIVLVGHSIGGLVVTESIALESKNVPSNEDEAESSWLARVAHVITLGSPFEGAPLERVSDSALKLAAVSPVAAPIVELGHARSQGVKDLGPGIDSTVPEHIDHTRVVAMLGPTESRVSKSFFGDGMVPISSARNDRRYAKNQESEFDWNRENNPASDPDGHQVVYRMQTNHLSLLDDPHVAEVLSAALQPGE